MAIQNVVLLGADGKLGPSVLSALVDAKFNVTVLKRVGSKSPSDYPASVKEARIPDDFPAYELSEIFKGQDAIVATIPGSQTELQMRLAAAAVNAGVKHFIPADFGSCDADSERARELVPLYVEKRNFRLYLQKLSDKNPNFSWTALVCGHFFDWEPKFLHINIKNQSVDFLDDGETRWSTSTLGQVGRATAKVLQNAEKAEIKNKKVFMQSFCINQKDVWRACEAATGNKWAVQKFDSKDFTTKYQKLLSEDDHEAAEELVWVLGTLEANWEGEKDFVNVVLGLEEEDLDSVVKTMIKDAS
ncbi:NmrA-like family protein [Tothia fuscella]|uniref:NmrA-like family protein n=1 Tax=Tothia fuscella TaxID=1048955 RepID=A0A9P4U306_9PEZI|nr:NmrA-like family protein [Tothia fuscella]